MTWLALLAGVTALPAAEIRWLVDAAPHAVEVSGVSAATLQELNRGEAAVVAARVLTVFTEPGGDGGTGKMTLPPVVGTWRVTENRLRFEPKFPLVHGVRYRAVFHAQGEPPLVSHFELPPRKPARSTEVVRIYPSGDVLPENQLKFYVQFSAPMSRGGVYQHVHVRDGEGREVDLPFLDLDEELWDPSMTRLTLLIDPGRIKRGVKPLEDIGPVFEEGKKYSLTLDAACRDAEGQPLGEKFEKAFRIGAADRTPPAPHRWQITPPKPGTLEPLIVNFDEPMDQALALRLINVAAGTKGKAAVGGDAALTGNERTWSFTPSAPWSAGPYRLLVATTIEDLAGNNIGKTFDVDLAGGAQRRLAAETVSVAFEVKQ
jgi:hypothetical protein